MVTLKTEPSLARQAWTEIHELFFGEANHERIHDACEAVGLTPGLMKALLSVQPDSAMTMKTLARQWRCDASYVTSLVDGLEERGIVERRSHPTDRRSKTVGLTPEGEQVRAALLDRLHEPPAALDVLTDAELRTVRDLLRKVRDAAGDGAPATGAPGAT